jgi:hypothetical protein
MTWLRTASRIRSASASAPAMPQPGSRTANSSPPRRPTIHLAHHLLTDGSKVVQHLVTYGMAPGIVHPLEVVDIQHQHRNRIAETLEAGKFISQFFHEAAPVGNAGERIGGGQHGAGFLPAACDW